MANAANDPAPEEIHGTATICFNSRGGVSRVLWDASTEHEERIIRSGLNRIIKKRKAATGLKEVEAPKWRDEPDAAKDP